VRAENQAMTGRGLRIRWAWLPAGIFVSAVYWHRHVVWWTLRLIAGGLVLGGWVKWRARRRRYLIEQRELKTGARNEPLDVDV